MASSGHRDVDLPSATLHRSGSFLADFQEWLMALGRNRVLPQSFVDDDDDDLQTRTAGIKVHHDCLLLLRHRIDGARRLLSKAARTS